MHSAFRILLTLSCSFFFAIFYAILLMQMAAAAAILYKAEEILLEFGMPEQW
jgi:hypothetical protein